MVVEKLSKAFTAMGAEWVMWLMIGLSVVSLAIVVERWRSLRSQEKLGLKLWKDYIDGWMARGGTRAEILAKANELAAQYPCLEGELVKLLVNQKTTDREELQLIAQSFLGKERLLLEKYMSFLGTVGSNAPFVGLFGTVVGIIHAFDILGQSMQTEGAQVLSGAIAEALVATGVGLMVAIPAVVAFNYFQRKIRMIMGRAESLANYLLSLK